MANVVDIYLAVYQDSWPLQLADPLNRWEGGEIILGNGVNMGLIRSTESSFQYWLDLAGYTGEPVKMALPDTNPKYGKTVERYQFREIGKPGMTPLKVIGGKYDYPEDVDVHLEAFFKRQKQGRK